MLRREVVTAKVTPVFSELNALFATTMQLSKVLKHQQVVLYKIPMNCDDLGIVTINWGY